MKHLINWLPLVLGGMEIAPSMVTWLLGVLIEETISFNGHIIPLTRNCYYQLQRIEAICRYILTSIAIELVHTFVQSRIDCCNIILLGLLDFQLNHLQSVLNVSACPIFGFYWNDHVMPLLRDKLHWL